MAPRIPAALRFKIPILSRLTRPQQILLGVLVLVVVAYITAVGTGGRHGDGNAADTRSGLVTWLGDVFGGPPEVPLEDMSAQCRQPDGGLVIDGTCVLHVAAGDSDVRNVTLTPDAPITVRAKVPSQSDFGVTQVSADEKISVAVDAADNDITITCNAEQACTVRVG